MKKIIDKKVKGHSYFLNPAGTKQFFDELSHRTEGLSEEFKID